MMFKSSRIICSVVAAFALLGCDANEPQSQPQAPVADTEMRGAEFDLDVKKMFGNSPFSCKGVCGDTAYGFCWCDELCAEYGDCCRDYEEQCQAPKTCGTRGAERCEEGNFCNFSEKADCGRTDLGGSCEPLPQACTREYKPVCGCDGNTYSNACVANSKGISVDYHGECETTGLVACGGELGDTCKETEYCAYTPTLSCGWADGTSVCKPRPVACDLDYNPVCGCDSKTYSNACHANAAGQGILKDGPCKPEPKTCGGFVGQQCDAKAGEFCNFPVSAQCGAADATGTCTKAPELCTEQYEPVCGCDGKTYSNACKAAAAKVSVVSEGACEKEPKTKCVSSNQCDYGEWCNTDPCLPCDAGPDGICPAVCFGYCEPLEKPLQLCQGDAGCDKGWSCDNSVCLSGCGNKPGVMCPAVCWGQCIPTPAS